jgi:hypothetical protein
MATAPLVLSYQGLLALMADEPKLRARLLAGDRFEARTPLAYPGRLGPVVVQLGLASDPASPAKAELQANLDSSAVLIGEGASSKAAALETPPDPLVPLIRISDCGGVLKCLAEQGMELDVDMILSKTVFHAVREHEGGGIAAGQVYVDAPPEAIGAGLWRFYQVVAEVIGLRHAKYKDALVQLERRRDAGADSLSWRPT